MRFPQARGTDGPDSLTGTTGDDILKGRDGDDRLYGGDGNDQLFGDGDDDSLYGGLGNDVLEGGDGRDTLFGGDGDDVAYLDVGAPSGTSVNGNGGNDYLSIGDLSGQGSDEAIRIDITLAGATLQVRGESIATVTGFETLEVVAGEGDDRVTAKGGNDFIFVKGGANRVEASEGDDLVGYTIGEINSLDGGDGFDLLMVDATADRGIVFDGAAGEDSVGSTIVGFEAFNVYGSDKVDDVRLGGNEDMASLGAGDDTASGLGGDDLLFGVGGRDTLRGDDGDDQLWGGEGGDWLYGGAGADSFWFSAVEPGFDKVKDFEDGVDVLMVDTAFTGAALSAGALDPGRLSFDAASGPGGQFVLIDEGSYDRLVWDGNGTASGGVVDIAALTGESGLAAEDIVLF